MARKVNHEQNLCIQAYSYMMNLRPLNAEIIHIPIKAMGGKPLDFKMF